MPALTGHQGRVDVPGQQEQGISTISKTRCVFLPLGFTESYLICIKNIHSDLIHEGFRKKQHATLHTVRGHLGLYLLKQH